MFGFFLFDDRRSDRWIDSPISFVSCFPSLTPFFGYITRSLTVAGRRSDRECRDLGSRSVITNVFRPPSFDRFDSNQQLLPALVETVSDWVCRV
jgi:hypothetical protein